MNKKKYLVVLTDIVDSRKIINRQAFRRALNRAILRVNRMYIHAFIAPIKIQKGIDELAMVIKPQYQNTVYTIMNELNDNVAPVTMRYAIVRGKIDTGFTQHDVSKMDGDAFHKAAAGIALLKENELTIYIKTDNTYFDTHFQAQANLLQILKNTWTIKQRKIYTLYKQLNNQYKVAQKMNVSQQTISKVLHSIQAKQVLQVEQSFEYWLTICNKQ